MNQQAMELIAMTDAVAINPRDTVIEVDFLAECAVKYGYPLVFVSQCFTEHMIGKLKGTGVKVGGGYRQQYRRGRGTARIQAGIGETLGQGRLRGD